MVEESRRLRAPIRIGPERHAWGVPLLDSVLDNRAAVAERSYLRTPERFLGPESAFSHWSLSRLALDDAHPDIVELGCGPGRDLAFYLNHGCRVMAVDWSPTALRRTEQSLHHVPLSLRPRVSLKLSDAVALVERLLPEIVDGVVAHLSYMTMQDEEIERLFDGIAAALRPGGWHLYAVRDTSDPNHGRGSGVEMNTFLGGPHEVPYRYFTRELCDRLAVGRFDPVERYADPAHHLLYVGDRKPFSAG